MIREGEDNDLTGHDCYCGEDIAVRSARLADVARFRKHSAAFRAKAALAVLTRDGTMSESAAKFDVMANWFMLMV